MLVIYLFSTLSASCLFSIGYTRCPNFVQIVVSVRNLSYLAENKSIFQQVFHSFCEKLWTKMGPVLADQKGYIP
jgi:hypothetical protein